MRTTGHTLPDFYMATLHAPPDPEVLPPDPRFLILAAIRQRREVTIQYVDNKGDETERRIRPMEDTGALVRAVCHLRGEDRSFRYDRISSVVMHEADPDDDAPPF